MTMEAASAESPADEKMSSLRSALRSAPRKRAAVRSPLKAAVAKLLPDLLKFRAKGYSGAELATIMREHGFVISARTLTRYIAELRPSATLKAKRKAVAPLHKREAAEAAPQQPLLARQAKIVAPAAAFVVRPLVRRKASDVLGHRFDDDV